MLKYFVDNPQINALIKAIADQNSIIDRQPDNKKDTDTLKTMKSVVEVMHGAVEYIENLEILLQDQDVIKQQNAAMTRYVRYLNSKYGPYIEIERQMQNGTLEKKVAVVEEKRSR